jgi:hypothetical protein
MLRFVDGETNLVVGIMFSNHISEVSEVDIIVDSEPQVLSPAK